MRDLRPLGALCQLFVCFVAQTGSVFPGKYWGNSQGFLLVTAPPKEGGGTSSDRLMGGLCRPPGEPPSWTPDKRCPAPWGRYKQLCWGPGATPAGLPQSAPQASRTKRLTTTAGRHLHSFKQMYQRVAPPVPPWGQNILPVSVACGGALLH